MLIPEIATGAAAELDELRYSARQATSDVCAGAGAVAVLVPGTADAPLTSWSLTGFGRDIGDGTPVELPIAIAGWLLEGRPAHILGTQVASGRLDSFDAVLAMGEGSAARTEKAPLHADPRAVAFDDLALAAIETGDLDALLRIDLQEAEDLGATGPVVWQSLAGLLDEVVSSELTARADPYGVQYLVATWRARWAAPA